MIFKRRKKKKEEKEKELKNMIQTWIDERLKAYRGVELWVKVHTLENELSTLRADFETWTPIVNSLNNHPALNNLAGKK